MHPSDNHSNAIDELAADADTAKAILTAHDGQFNRRVYVRTLFAYLEGFSFFMRRNAEEILRKRTELGRPVKAETEFLLNDKIPRIGSKGKIINLEHRVPFSDHFAFTLRTVIEALEIKNDPFTEPGWDALQRALKVRDRITHPKTQPDVEISDKDMCECELGLSWFRELISRTTKEHWGIGKE